MCVKSVFVYFRSVDDTENGVAGVIVVVAVAPTAGGTMISRRHVAGVRRRKSHG